METNILRLFPDALAEVFKEVGVFPVRVSDADSKKKDYELVCSLGITGDIHGYLILKSNLSSARDFIDRMALHVSMDMEEKEFGPVHKAAMAELTNQISGRATMKLSENGFDCSITPPTIITGSNVYSDILNLERTLNQEIRGEFGSFVLFVGIKNAKKRFQNS